jgi:aspartate-semialdehyde dehydrogenase
MALKVAVAGATGEVGRTITRALEEQNVRPGTIDFYSSARSAGSKIDFGGRAFTVKELTEEAARAGYDYFFFSAGGAVSSRFAPLAAGGGSVVIDNSSAFRMEDSVPLVTPEINGDLLKGYRGIVANPNCSTIQMVLALYKIHEEYGLKTVVVSTYQSVSGAGRSGIDELEAQEGGDMTALKFARQIHRNLIPRIGSLLENGFTDEEMKMVNETRKILRDPRISIWPTAVRVPVAYCHSEAIFAETERPFTPEGLEAALKRAENVILTEDRDTPLDMAGTDLTAVSRVRSFDNTRFLMWNVADNIRTGAATNAVRIMLKHRELNG